MRLPRAAAIVAACVLSAAGCSKPRYIDTMVRNESGAELRTVEVDYPGGSFGTTRIAAGASFHYRFKPLHTGGTKLLYSEGGKELTFAGPDLKESVGGTMQIVVRTPTSPQRVAWTYAATDTPQQSR